MRRRLLLIIALLALLAAACGSDRSTAFDLATGDAASGAQLSAGAERVLAAVETSSAMADVSIVMTAEAGGLPQFDGEAVLFEEAVSPVPTTLPSHSTMFTGLLPQDHGVRYNIFFRLTDEATTLAETLKQAGFATAAFPASHIVAERYGLSQGFDTWVEPPATLFAFEEDGREPTEAEEQTLEAWFSDNGGENAVEYIRVEVG